MTEHSSHPLIYSFIPLPLKVVFFRTCKVQGMKAHDYGCIKKLPKIDCAISLHAVCQGSNRNEMSCLVVVMFPLFLVNRGVFSQIKREKERKERQALESASVQRTDTEEYTIPHNTKRICQMAHAGCASLGRDTSLLRVSSNNDLVTGSQGSCHLGSLSISSSHGSAKHPLCPKEISAISTGYEWLGRNTSCGLPRFQATKTQCFLNRSQGPGEHLHTQL